MRQLITRIDDDLHKILKRRARQEGRSVNSLVTEILLAAVTNDDPVRELKRRLDGEGLRVIPPRPKSVPSRAEALAAGKGMGHRVSSELERQRADR